MRKFLSAVREACLSAVWAQGVRLAREGAVSGREDGAGSVTVRVGAPGTAVPATVTLYTEDPEWTCDCEAAVDPCAHVAAAAIAVSEERVGPARGAAEKPKVALAAHVGYRLSIRAGVLALERTIVEPSGEETLVRGSITARSVAAKEGAPLPQTHEDLTIDRLVSTRQPGYYPAHREKDLFAALAASADVRFEGEPIKMSTEPIVPHGQVGDQGDGVVLTIEGDPRVTAMITGGVVRCGDTLHLLGEMDLSGTRLERLPLRRVFARAELGKLVGEVLPGLERRIQIDIKTRRLPRAGGRSAPRIHFDLAQRDHTLSVHPTLVYGDPPLARIEEGKLLHLGGEEVPVRDETAERALIARLRDELHLVPGRKVEFDGADAIRLAQRIAAWGADAGAKTHDAMAGRATLVPKLVIDGSHFDLSFEVVEGDETESDKSVGAEAVLRAFQEGLPFAPLEGGGWAALPAEWLALHGDKVAELLAARRDDKRVPKAALPALAELCEALDRPPPPGLEELRPLFDGFSTLPRASLPPDLTATLRAYQRYGVDWLSFLRDAGLGAILADDMGLGKTLQALAVLKGKTLVVCPRSVVHNWAEEIRRFRPGMTCSIYHGSSRTLDPSADVTLTTYALLRIDAELFAATEWDTVVLDEAQAIKNPDSQSARAAYALSAGFRIALSGTPVENRLEELWSLLHFTNRGLLGGRSAFRSRFERPIAEGDAEAAVKLRRKVSPFVLRRMKREVAPELPPRTESILYCELEDDERVAYDAVRAATRKEIVARLGQGLGILAALEALLRLRQAACHTGLLPGREAETSSKIVRLLAALEEAAEDGHKALVFSQWTSFLDRVEPHLKAAKIAFCRLDGSTRDRAAVVAEFQDPEGPPVMLLSLKAGGVGLNLTAADHVFLLDPWWNPAVEDQAADRAHRIGQDRPVMVFRLVAKDTVEEGILALQERKRKVADVALGAGEAASGITREDLMALLE